MYALSKTSHPRVQAIILDDARKEQAIIVDMGRYGSTCWTVFSRPNQEKMRKESRREWDGLSQEHPNQNEIILQILLICLRKSLRYMIYMCFPLFWHFSIHNKDWRSWFLQNSCRRILTHLQIIQSPSSQSPASSQELQRESPPMPGRAFNDINKWSLRTALDFEKWVTFLNFFSVPRTRPANFLGKRYYLPFVVQAVSFAPATIQISRGKSMPKSSKICKSVVTTPTLLPLALDLVQAFPFFGERLGLLSSNPSGQHKVTYPAWAKLDVKRADCLNSFFWDSSSTGTCQANGATTQSSYNVHGRTRHYTASHLQVFASHIILTAVSW